MLVLDHAAKPAEKVRISGGGRCNFTNIHTSAANFLSENPHFAKSALARYTPADFCDLLARHAITWHEKTLGQLFCDGRSGAIINMLLEELATPGGELRLDTSVQDITRTETGFRVHTTSSAIDANHLVIAAGGLSIPKMGATGFAYDVARQFGHTIIEPRPALVPLTFSGTLKEDFEALSGTATQAHVSTGDGAFSEAILFTHRGLSGPAILQASSYWRESEHVALALLPGMDLASTLKAMRGDTPKRVLGYALGEHLPRALVDMLGKRLALPVDTKLGDLSNTALETLTGKLTDWQIKPTGTEGWRKAEVTAGGVDTSGLSSKTMESRHQPDLYFIGECVDVTGWLGGYNFQWAWASAMATGRHISGL